MTGSASCIGRECAIAIAREGAAVVVADLDLDGARRVAGEITLAAGRAHPIRVDLGDAASVEALVPATVDRFGRLDLLHNNAAATHLAATRDLDVGDMDLEVWETTMRINLTGTMLATKFALPHLVAAGGGSIVNTSSGASLGGDLGHTAYGVSKSAINALTRYTATQYGKAGVRCNAVAPGLVVTPASADNYAGPMGEMMLRHHLTPGWAARPTSPPWWSSSARRKRSSSPGRSSAWTGVALPTRRTSPTSRPCGEPHRSSARERLVPPHRPGPCPIRT